MPPVAVVSARLNEVGASLKVKLIVAVPWARLTSVLLVVTATRRGDGVDHEIAGAGGAGARIAVGLVQLPAVTLTDPLLMSVSALAVKVAV